MVGLMPPPPLRQLMGGNDVRGMTAGRFMRPPQWRHVILERWRDCWLPREKEREEEEEGENNDGEESEHDEKEMGGTASAVLIKLTSSSSKGGGLEFTITAAVPLLSRHLAVCFLSAADARSPDKKRLGEDDPQIMVVDEDNGGGG